MEISPSKNEWLTLEKCFQIELHCSKHCASSSLLISASYPSNCEKLCQQGGSVLPSPFMMLLLAACSGSGEGEDEDEFFRASSTLSLLLDSNSSASCSFLLAFFSFFRRFWMEARGTSQNYQHMDSKVLRLKEALNETKQPWVRPLLCSSEVSCRSRLSLISLSR